MASVADMIDKNEGVGRAARGVKITAAALLLGIVALPPLLFLGRPGAAGGDKVSRQLGLPVQRNDVIRDARALRHKGEGSLRNLFAREAKEAAQDFGSGEHPPPLKERILRRPFSSMDLDVRDAALDSGLAGSRALFRVVPVPGGAAPLSPSEILVEVLYPRMDCRYSVTIFSLKYTGTVQILREEQTSEYVGLLLGKPGKSLVHSWRPFFPGEYKVLVHEINPFNSKETPPIDPSPLPIYIHRGEQAGGYR